MYPIAPNERLVETKTCRHCNVSFPITDKDLEFYEKVSPVFGGKKYPIPTPTLCPDCRQQRIFSHRNDRKIYKKVCDASGKSIISTYSPDKPYKVYSSEYWWSDDWDPMSYGRDLDFSRPFFEQFDMLLRDVPHLSTIVLNGENADYCAFCNGVKDSYLSQRVGNGENIYYTYLTLNSGHLFDSYNTHDSEQCYSCIDCEHCYGVHFSQNTFHSKHSYHLFNCANCEHCAFCYNIRGGKYMYFNEQLSETEYAKMIDKFLFTSHEEKEKIVQEFQKMITYSTVPEIYGIGNENVNGNYIFTSKNIKQSFDIINCEDSSYSTGITEAKGVIDSAFGYFVENAYSYSTGSKSSHLFCVYNIWASHNILYSMMLNGCSNCFGCVGLKNKSYYIFNKQYTKEEYEELVPKIIEYMQKTGEWGEFFPSSLSPFGYNETVAQEYYPLDRRDVSEKHLYPDGKPIFNWSDYESPFPKVEKIIPANKLPDDISKIPDDILNWAIECEVTGKPFRIIGQELEFYRKHNLPIPRRHPDQRHLDRMALRNPRKLFERKCDKCGVEIITTYGPERPEVVYCEGCYNKEVF